MNTGLWLRFGVFMTGIGLGGCLAVYGGWSGVSGFIVFGTNALITLAGLTLVIIDRPAPVRWTEEDDERRGNDYRRSR